MTEVAIKMKMAPPEDKIMEEGKCKLCKIVEPREKELMGNSLLYLQSQ